MIVGCECFLDRLSLGWKNFFRDLSKIASLQHFDARESVDSDFSTCMVFFVELASYHLGTPTKFTLPSLAFHFLHHNNYLWNELDPKQILEMRSPCISSALEVTPFV